MGPTAGSSAAGGSRRARPRHWRHAASTALLAAALAACGGKARLSQGRGYLRADIETSPTSLDPRFATDALSSRIMELTFDSLVKLDAHGDFVGDLARTIERPTETTLVFHLRPGLRFSDGRGLSARDVKCTFDSVLDPATGSPKRAGLEQLAAIDAPDDHTVIMTTRRPYAPALEMAMLAVLPCSTPPSDGLSTHPPGSGPFRITAFSRDQAVVLERNPFRPRPDSAPPGVTFKIVPDPTVRALELAKGTADFAENNIQPELLGYLERQPHLRVDRFSGTAYQYLVFNFRNPRLRDLRVRRAIAMAIDRRAIVDSMLRDTARLASGMLAPENWAYEPAVRRYPYDPAAARRLLEEAGYPERAERRERFALSYKTTAEGRRLAEALQAMLGRVGVGLEIRSSEWATFYSDVQHGNFDLASLAWVGINDPHHYYMVFDSHLAPPRGLNRGYYSNARMDELVEAGDATIERERRRFIYRQVQRLAADDLPYVSLWWLDNVTVMNRRLAGFEPYPNGSLISFSTLTLAGAATVPGR